VKAAQRALEDAEFSDDPDGKKRRLRKRRAAAKKRRAKAKAIREGREPGEDDGDSDDDDDDDEEQQQPQSTTQPPTYARAPVNASTSGARAPAIAPASVRPKPRPKAVPKGTAARKGAAAANGKTTANHGNAAQPRTTTTMQIEHLTQQQTQPDTMMQWDDGNYQANQDMDDSGDDEYYSAGTFGNQAADSTTGAGWSALDTEKITKVRNAATTLLGLALERSDVGPDNMQQCMINVLDWCRRQEESLPPAVPPPPPQPLQQQTRLHNVAPTYTAPAQPASTASSRLPPQYAAHTHVMSSAQPTYAPDQGYTTNEPYSAPSYSTLASATAAAPTSYQLPHSAPTYTSTQPYHPTHTYNNPQTYSTQYNAHNYPSGHTYNTRIGL
jgi:hypothetical protein